MNLIAKIQYSHRDDRDASYVLYELKRGDKWHSEYVVWTESSTGDRYWGHYFPYLDADEKAKEQAYWDAHKCFIRLAARKYNVPTLEDDQYFSANERDNLKTI